MLVEYDHYRIRVHVPEVNLLGSGFISSDMYQHGFFSALIKLPSDYTAGVVVAFYVSFHPFLFFLILVRILLSSYTSSMSSAIYMQASKYFNFKGNEIKSKYIGYINLQIFVF